MIKIAKRRASSKEIIMKKKLLTALMVFLSGNVVAKNFCHSIEGKWVSIQDSEKIILNLKPVSNHLFQGEGYDRLAHPSLVHITGACDHDELSLSSTEGKIKGHMLSNNSFSIDSSFIFKKVN